MALVQDENPYLKASSAVAVTQREQDMVKRGSTESYLKEKLNSVDEKHTESTDAPSPVEEEEDARRHANVEKIRSLAVPALALLILGWWISATVLKETRHRWIVQTFFAWWFILIIVFRYVPTTIITRPIESVWIPLIERPWYNLSYPTRLTIGWLCLLGIVFGSAFGFPLQEGTTYGDRAISVLGLAFFQFCFWLSSSKRKHIPWPTIIVGLFLQQAIALFVLKSKAGFDIFRWIATLAGDFLGQGEAGAKFFFDAETISKHWFFVNTVSQNAFIIVIHALHPIFVTSWPPSSSSLHLSK
ncbi:hypothetical protein H0H81_005342 [Sphagnurus paluster]|uniref:Concentrative nucleoside transporter N-terminal domain-containing protein n=1 Tax=Sphagnurus paluster TaxID=117069 RepID=A0A9P7FTZ3_9AGAR|nr:hypothetical protein H0H81_005342 [Sphagnurus paluster]